MIMTAPFNELNLMNLMPTTASVADNAGAPMAMPSSPRDMLKLIRSERKRIKETGVDLASIQAAPPRGEMLLVKQLVFFERYGKMFLGDQPLIYDPEVYKTLLEVSAPTAT
jgi:hypothetical protein